MNILHSFRNSRMWVLLVFLGLFGLKAQSEVLCLSVVEPQIESRIHRALAPWYWMESSSGDPIQGKIEMEVSANITLEDCGPIFLATILPKESYSEGNVIYSISGEELKLEIRKADDRIIRVLIEGQEWEIDLEKLYRLYIQSQ